jgi:hypothetical protein
LSDSANQNRLSELSENAPSGKSLCAQIRPPPTFGGAGNGIDLVDIFVPHEEEHARELRKIIEETVR